MILINRLFQLRRHPAVQSLGTYTFTNFFGKGVSFLLLPYFTHVLTKSDMGILNLFSSSIIFLMPFISMGVLQSINADFFKLDKKSFKDAFTTSFLLPFMVFIVSLVVFYIFRNFLHEKYKLPYDFFWLIPVIGFMTFIGEHIINMIRNNNRPKQFMVVVLGRMFLEISIAVCLISILRLGWRGRIDGILVSYACLTIFAGYYFIRKGYLFGEIKTRVIKDELTYSLPIIAMQFSIFAMNASDSFFLSRFTNDNNAEVGIYGIACIFGSIVLTLSSAMVQFTFPNIYRLLSEPVHNYAQIRKHFYLCVGVMTGGLLLVLLFTPLAYKYFISSAYAPGLKYYYLLCIGYYFWAITFVFYSFMLYFKQKRKLLTLSVTFIILSLVSNYLFIKNYGSFGAAVSVCAVYFIVFVVTVIFTRKETGFIFRKGR